MKKNTNATYLGRTISIYPQLPNTWLISPLLGAKAIENCNFASEEDAIAWLTQTSNKLKSPPVALALIDRKLIQETATQQFVAQIKQEFGIMSVAIMISEPFENALIESQSGRTNNLQDYAVSYFMRRR